MKYDIKNKLFKKEGKKRIEWALQRMPVLELIRERFKKSKPLKNINIAACLHVTTETASLAITLKEGGANINLCASNPLSTQDDVAASLVYDFDIPVFAINNEDRKTYYKHIYSVLSINPNITMDDGADLVSTIHKEFVKRKDRKVKHLPWGSTEETTTGVIRLRALEEERRLLYPIIAVNDAYTKHLFDNRYGTGQSTLDGIIRATNKLIAGSTFVVCGYGWCGRGIARRAQGLGANVIVCEVNPLYALEAVMDGFRVMPLVEAARIGDIFVTATGDKDVITKKHFLLMKDKVILANAGHFDVEVDLKALNTLAVRKREVKPLVTEYAVKSSLRRSGLRLKRIYVLAEGRLVNLVCAEGHPAEVMDLSFANQALSCEYIVNNYSSLEKKVYSVPYEIDMKVASLKLEALGIRIDKLSLSQQRYLSSWQEGT
mgnify:CR=1 FL=1